MQGIKQIITMILDEGFIMDSDRVVCCGGGAMGARVCAALWGGFLQDAKSG